jgi:hypothetical protein
MSDPMRIRLRAAAWGWTAAALLVLTYIVVQVGLPHDPEAGDLGRELQGLLGVVLVVLLAVGAVLSIRWPAVSAVVMVSAAVLIGVYASIQYSPVVELAVAGAFLVPAALIWASWRPQRGSVAVLAVAVLGVILPWAGYHAAWQVYDHFTGPAHPASPLASAPATTLDWLWAGATTEHGFTVKAKLARPAQRVRLLVQAEGSERRVAAAVGGPYAQGSVASLRASDLTSGRRHTYDVEVDGEVDPHLTGTVTTFPTGAADFTIAFASCASTGSSGAVFDAIREHDPLAFLHLGDLHYADLRADDDSARRSTLDRVLTSPAQAALYRSTSVVYVWDDHDFLGNDSDGTSPGSSSALRVYREYVPHHRLPLGEGGPVAQAFTIGRLRFVVTDPRAGRVPAGKAADAPTMLGPAQLEWFEREVRAAAADHAAVVWVNPVPWIDPPDPGSDAWGGFDEERRRIAEILAGPASLPVMMLSGDAHMLAIDDGTNSSYARRGDGFPVFQAGALDRRGSVKGGPYSHGTFPGPGQFGLVEVHDDGERIEVGWTGLDWTGRTVVEHTFELVGPADP